MPKNHKQRDKATTLLLGLFAATFAHAQESAPAAPTAPTTTAPPVTAPAPAPIPAPAPAPAPAGFGGFGGSAEPSPFVFGVRVGYSTDSNLFRAPEGSGLVVRDEVTSAGLHLGVDKSIGRQRFLIDARANNNSYRRNEQLDNTDYSAMARWDWATVERLSGELSAMQRQSLYRDTSTGVVTSERNQLRTTSLGFQARLGLVTRWSFEAGVAASENEYEGTAAVASRDSRQRAANAGIRWRPSEATSFRLGVRRADGTYPSISGEPDDFTRDDIDLSASFAPSGASRLNARISATREEHTRATARDTDGWTGALGWDWTPTGKLTVALDLSRDSSVGRTSLESALIEAEASDVRRTENATLGVTWAATGKINVTPRYTYLRRKLDPTLAGGGTATGDASDRTSILGLGVHYQPTRAIGLSCDVAREQRRVNGTSTVSVPYDATVGGCSIEFALR